MGNEAIVAVSYHPINLVILLRKQTYCQGQNIGIDAMPSSIQRTFAEFMLCKISTYFVCSLAPSLVVFVVVLSSTHVPQKRVESPIEWVVVSCEVPQVPLPDLQRA